MNLVENRIRKKVVSLNIDIINYKNTIVKIFEQAKNKRPGYVCFANVHMTIEAYWDNDFANQVNNAMLVLPDGMPIVKSLQLFYNKKQERIAGMDFFPSLIKLADEQDLRILFFGSTNEVLNAIRDKVGWEFPKAKIAGMISPLFGKSLDEEPYVEIINGFAPNIVFVALGCPKQEKWMAANYEKINAPLLGVGGAFSVYAGLVKRAPGWMQKLSLEWLYRLLQEPGRMWKRYLVTNTMFIYLAALQLINKRRLL